MPNEMTGQPNVNGGGENSTNAGQTASQEINAGQQTTEGTSPASENQNQMMNTSGQSEEKNNTDNQEGENRQEPTSLSEALTMLNEDNAKRSEDNVSDGEGTDNKQQPATSEQMESGTSQSSDNPESTGSSVQDQHGSGTTEQDNQTGGESTDSPAKFDRAAYIKDVDNKIQQQVEDDIKNGIKNMSLKEAQEAGIRMYNTDDLIDKEAAKDGYVRFINPDTNEPFEDRGKAIEWCNYVNEQAKSKLNNLKIQMINKTRQEAQGGVELQIFLNETMKNVKDKDIVNAWTKVIEPYAVKGKDGKVYKYNCNLQQALQIAEYAVKAKRYDELQKNGGNQQPANGTSSNNPNDVSHPAVDAKTSRVATDNNNTPKKLNNLGDAFQVLAEEEKEKNNG